MISLQQAIDLSLVQVSAYRNAELNSLISTEDVRQAKAGFVPKVSVPLNFIYSSPSLGPTRPRPPAFLGANAITEYQALIEASGEIDTSGKLKATLAKNNALLESAKAGSEVAKRDLIQSVTESYYTLALASAKRAGAESNLEIAAEFERVTKLNVDAGEVAPIDLVRARLQTQNRRDEFEQAKSDENVNSVALKFLIGGDLTQPVTTTDLLIELPAADEVERFSAATLQSRPEFAQYAADAQVAEKDIALARSERRPQLTYSVGAGFVSDSLRLTPLKNQTGVQATVGFTIPIFDGGASKSRETQAKLKLQQVENQRQIADRQFAQEFFSYRDQALSARGRISLLAATIRDAEANVSTSVSRYRAGEAQISEVIDAQNLLVTQKQSFYKAIFDYQIAKSRLARSVGR